MPDQNYRRSRSRRGGVQQQAAQEATLARERAGQASAGSVTSTSKEEQGTKPRITLQDGSVVAADLAFCTWHVLKDYPQQEPAAFRWLLAQAQGQAGAADDRHTRETLEVHGFVETDGTIEAVTRAVIVNSHTTENGVPIVGALRLKSAVDKAIFEEARTQYHQDFSESVAHARKAGGWLDQLWEKMQEKRRQGGQSID